ncbi:MAG: ABC transporter permease [Acidobacteria bacterium]|nr:ABC transporter permease [Acidobacteriota bacterium]
MNNLWKDLRYGKRMLLKNSGFTIIAVMTLALGMGANTAIFSVVNAVLLRSLPYHNANELMDIYSTNKQEVEYQGPISPVTYLNLKKNNGVFTEMAAISNKGWAANLTGNGEPERLQGYQVSANLFQFLGVAPAQGRAFMAAEDQPGNNRVVLLSHEAWQKRFGGNAELVGRSINLNGSAYTVIGVMPEDFRYLTKTDVWTPLAFTTADEKDEAGYLMVGGRLKPGISVEQALAEVDRLYRHQLNNPNSDARVGLKPLQESMTQTVERRLWILFAAVGFVLLIACANVANLLLARGSVRRRELAIRAAMGADRSRLVRQLLVESAMLALLGAAGGLLLADWGISFLVGGIPEYLKLANSNLALLSIDRWALGFTFAMAFSTTIIFGLLPALNSSKVNLNDALKEGGLSDAKGGGQNRIRSLLVVSEIALALILLVGAGLMLKSFWRLSNVDPGFTSTGVLTANIDPTYKEFEQVVAFYRHLLERVSTIPGIEHAGIINSRVRHGISRLKSIRRSRRKKDRVHRTIRWAEITFAPSGFRCVPDAFSTTVSIGKHVRYHGASREIVGVVGASKFYSLDEKLFPHIYLPLSAGELVANGIDCPWEGRRSDKSDPGNSRRACRDR